MPNINVYVDVDSYISTREFNDILDDNENYVESWLENNKESFEHIFKEESKELNFRSSDDFKRHICDLLGVGYHQYNTDELLAIIKNKME